MMTALLHPRLLAALGLIALGLGVWWHYTSLRDDLRAAEIRAPTAETAAQTNLAAALRADADRRLAVSALEAANARIQASEQLSKEAEVEIREAAPETDGPVAPVLEALRARRFSK